MKYLMLLVVLVVAGCSNQPGDMPVLRENDLVLSAAGKNPATGQAEVPANVPIVTVSSVGIILKVDYTMRSKWQYFCAFEGTTGWFEEGALRRVGHLDWSKLGTLSDDPKSLNVVPAAK